MTRFLTGLLALSLCIGSAQAAITSNALTQNALTQNGVSRNALSRNAPSTNGQDLGAAFGSAHVVAIELPPHAG